MAIDYPTDLRNFTRYTQRIKTYINTLWICPADRPPLVPCGATVWGWNWAALVASERKRLCFAMGTCFNQMAWSQVGDHGIPMDTSKIHQYPKVTTFVRRFMNYKYQLSAGPRGSGSPLCSLQPTSRKSKPIARQCLANRIYIAFLGLQCEYILKKNMGI